MIKVKFHLHSHITRKIQGYAHDFCNTAIIEKTTPDIPFITHNLFGFDFFFLVLVLISTLSDKEIVAVKKVTEKCLNEHCYFSTIWPYLSFKKKEKILDIIAEGKGVLPYELIVDMQSFL